MPTGIRFLDAVAALGAARIEEAARCGQGTTVQVKMAKLPSDVNLKVAEFAMRSVTDPEKEGRRPRAGLRRSGPKSQSPGPEPYDPRTGGRGRFFSIRIIDLRLLSAISDLVRRLPRRSPSRHIDKASESMIVR